MSASAILKLQKVGFTSEQVEALADFMDTQAASKADLEAAVHKLELAIADVRTEIGVVRAELKADVAALRSELRTEVASIRSDMSSLEQRLTIKLGTMMVVAVTAVAALVKAL